ncbi:NUMOD4 domain-containing protein [Streptomyces althioticus]|uniref:NUMOD4 domain-containing protein n=1 Tax=Streptomyces althioticus TaxID=83380 RepID=UPI0033EE6BA2
MENWKPIPGYDGYEVSDQGRVRSWRKMGRWGGTLETPKVMKQTPNPNGYLKVNLQRNGMKVTNCVHVLVAKAFLGPRPGDLDVCHNDGDMKNNRLRNLRYDTVSGNMADRISHGTDSRGEKSWNAKLTEEEVLLIRKLHETHDFNQRELARKFGVDYRTINQIIHRRRWAHV